MGSNQNRRDVSGNRRDGYKVTEGGKVTSTARTQRQAESQAKAEVHEAGGGQVYIHRPDGKIRDADTVKPGNSSRRGTEGTRRCGEQCVSGMCAPVLRT